MKHLCERGGRVSEKSKRRRGKRSKDWNLGSELGVGVMLWQAQWYKHVQVDDPCSCWGAGEFLWPPGEMRDKYPMRELLSQHENYFDSVLLQALVWWIYRPLGVSSKSSPVGRGKYLLFTYTSISPFKYSYNVLARHQSQTVIQWIFFHFAWTS